MLLESLEYVRIFALNRFPIDAFICFRYFILVCYHPKKFNLIICPDNSILNWCFLGILSSLLWRNHLEANNVLRCFVYTEFHLRETRPYSCFQPSTLIRSETLVWTQINQCVLTTIENPSVWTWLKPKLKRENHLEKIWMATKMSSHLNFRASDQGSISSCLIVVPKRKVG